MLRDSAFTIGLGLVLMTGGSGCDHSQVKRILQHQETQISTAVLLDVLQQTEARGAPVVCVGIANDPGSPRTDPPPAIIASLRSKNASTYRVSECDESRT